MVTSLPVILGTSHCLKITPKASYVGVGIPSTDQLFKVSLLSDAKFSNWKTVATGANKIGVVDSVSRSDVDRYIDPNYNIATPAGSLWFRGAAESGRSFYLQTGSGVSKTNLSSVFFDLYTSCHGFEIASGNPVDRCGRYNGTATDLTYSQGGIIGSGVGFNGSTSKINLGDVNEIDGQPAFSLTMLVKQTVLDAMGIFYNKSGNSFYTFFDGNLYGGINQGLPSYANFDYSTVVTADTFFLLDVVFDGSQTGNVNRYKIYVNGQPLTLAFVGDMPATTMADSLVFEYGTTGIAFAGVLDEARFGPVAKSAAEILWRYNQWFQADYWVTTVQPVVTGFSRISGNSYTITGSGFKPEATDPIVELNGTVVIPTAVSDGQITVSTGYLFKNFSITNSDGNIVSFSHGDTSDKTTRTSMDCSL